MTPGYDQLVRLFKSLPGLGFRSAERIVLHLLVEKPEKLNQFIEQLHDSASSIGPCANCGNLSEGDTCSICLDEEREIDSICVIERVPDLFAIERSSAYRGLYHVLQGKLSPLRGIGPEQLNLSTLDKRLKEGCVKEVILALGNDLESEATCHYIQEEIVGEQNIKVSRIGFGLPSGGGVTFADEMTLKNALESRRALDFS
ncbi:MAG: recombination mediator RecR [Opitutales bacterium]|nr:recombination mediator RecR [Opitutales bacterium]